ncbi:MAG: hypothetical protein U1F67_11030 [Rubrivivax sp.]
MMRASSPSAALTRLPSLFSARVAMPEIGAVTTVYDRFSSASRTRACCACTGFGERERARGVVGFAARDGLHVGQRLQARGLAPCLVGLGLFLRQAGTRLCQRDLERRAVDREHRRAGAHRLAFAVLLALQDAAHARALPLPWRPRPGRPLPR